MSTKKLTTEQFIDKAILVHGNRYDYFKVEYINSSTKILIVCEKHGDFLQTPNSHISQKSGCPVCADEYTQQLKLEKYGIDRKEIKDKIKKTNLERYGVENPSQSNVIKEKKKTKCLFNYGVMFPSQNEEIKDKIKKTNFERYGVENPFSNKEVQEKIKNTNFERYGIKYPMQSKVIQETMKENNLKKYGVNHSAQKNMLDIILLIEDKEWLFEQYIVQNKTSTQIGVELGVNGTTICDYLRKYEIEIRYTVGYSMKCIQWLESIMVQENIFIQHASNIGEFKIPGTRYKVDGYCEENNTVYEFHGDCFHGNPDLFNDDDKPNFYKNHLTAKELYDKTKERENKIKELGFNLVVIWENDFN